MSLLDFHDSEQKKLNRSYLVHLVHVSKADGGFSEKEKHVLFRLGHKLGFVDEEISKIIDKPGTDSYQPPYELKEKIEHLYDIIRVTLADEVITEDESRITHFYAIAAGFDKSEAVKVIEFVKKGITENKDEEEIFKDYLKKSRK